MNITGRVGGTLAGYSLNLAWDGVTLKGRIGGGFGGADVRVTYSNATLAGRVGGRFGGFNVRGFIHPTVIDLRFSGEVLGMDLKVNIEEAKETSVWGRYGGRIFGKDVALSSRAGRTDGRIGGAVGGKDVHLEHDAPVELAVVAAFAAYKALEDATNTAAVASGSN